VISVGLRPARKFGFDHFLVLLRSCLSSDVPVASNRLLSDVGSGCQPLPKSPFIIILILAYHCFACGVGWCLLLSLLWQRCRNFVW
jgi:hypothetical protein